MNVTRHSRWILTTVTALVAVVVAVMIVGVLDRPERGQPHAEVDTHRGLLVTTRTDFRICVESRPATADGQRSTVERSLHTSLDGLRRHRDWQKAYRDARYDPETSLKWGCPAPRLPERYERVMVAGPGLTENPSPYRVWVYLLDDPTADRVIGPGTPAVIATAESMRSGHTDTFPVSTALLIRHTTLANSALATRYLSEAAGLTPA